MFRLKDNVKATIAQIIICVLLFPFFMVFISNSVETAAEFFLDLIKEIPIMEIWLELLVDFKDIDGLLIGLEELERNRTEFFLTAIYQVYVVGFVAEIFSDICKKLSWKGLPIIPTIVAVLVAFYIQKYTSTDLESICISAAALLIVYIVIKFFVVKISAIKTIITFFIRLYFNTLIALSATAYISMLALICTGKITDTTQMAIGIITSFAALVLSMIISYLITPKKKV